jgi:hypothetical protein
VTEETKWSASGPKQRESAGIRLTKWLGTKRQMIGDVAVLFSEYYRTSIENERDIWHVRLFRVWNGQKSFTLTVSYELAAATMLRPITDRIAYSLRFQ